MSSRKELIKNINLLYILTYTSYTHIIVFYINSTHHTFFVLMNQTHIPELEFLHLIRKCLDKRKSQKLLSNHQKLITLNYNYQLIICASLS
ncbi:MAG: hypothetical protein [Cressdnaviricota sp.]|nr:MAG: hypothetical protein [Cressdnaviricota sp.]